MSRRAWMAGPPASRAAARAISRHTTPGSMGRPPMRCSASRASPAVKEVVKRTASRVEVLWPSSGCTRPGVVGVACSERGSQYERRENTYGGRGVRRGVPSG
ncbi:hypothetical protein NR798_13755 [Archangium gephyra]